MAGSIAVLATATLAVMLGTTIVPGIAVRFSPSAAVVYAAALKQPHRFVFPTVGTEDDLNAFRRRIERRPRAYVGCIEASAMSPNDDDRAAAAITARLLVAGRTDLQQLATVLDRLRSDPSERVRRWASE